MAALASTRDVSDVVLISPVADPHGRRAPTVLLRFLRSCLHEPPRVVALALYAYALCGVRWIFRILPAVLRFRVEDVLPRVAARTLVVSGEQDRLVSPAWAQEVAGLLPDGRAWRIPGAAHSVMHRDAEEVARLCVQHVRGDLPADGEVHRVPEETVQANDGPLGLRGAWRAAKGRLTEVVGVLRDDDATIARGKTEQARAEELAEGVADDR